MESRQWGGRRLGAGRPTGSKTHRGFEYIDALIGIKVMGQYPGCENFPKYSSDFECAMRVVEIARNKSDGHFTLLAFTTNWRAGFFSPYPSVDFGTSYIDFVKASTAPLAICYAALALYGIPVHERDPKVDKIDDSLRYFRPDFRALVKALREARGTLR